MKARYHGLPLLAVIVALSIVGGCSKESPTETITSDDQYFESIIQGNDAASKDLFVSDEEALNETGQLSALVGVLNKASTVGAVTPLRWGRVIRSVSRQIIRPVTKVGDTTVIAETRVTFTGLFVIQAISGVDTVVIKKPFTEVIHRSVKFQRVAYTRYPRLNWRLDAVAVANGSTASPALAITQVEVIAPNRTLTVTDPDNYYMEIERWWVRNIPVFQNVPVTLRVTVQSGIADSEFVALHYAPGDFGLHHAPFLLKSQTVNNGVYTRVYERSWTISGSIRKYAHIMVSATTRESLLTDVTTNFSSAVWGIPYKTSQ
jgi:hypothetical protein